MHHLFRSFSLFFFFFHSCRAFFFHQPRYTLSNALTPDRMYQRCVPCDDAITFRFNPIHCRTEKGLSFMFHWALLAGSWLKSSTANVNKQISWIRAAVSLGHCNCEPNEFNSFLLFLLLFSFTLPLKSIENKRWCYLDKKKRNETIA